MANDERKIGIEKTGRVAMAITCHNTTLGPGDQCRRIVNTGQTPSLLMIFLSGMTFLSWRVWAASKRPTEFNVFSTAHGFMFTLLVIVLSVSNNRPTTCAWVPHGSPLNQSEQEVGVDEQQLNPLSPKADLIALSAETLSLQP